MLVKEAKAIIGSLGKPSKMPGFSYGLPACEAKWVPEFCKNLNLPIPPHYGCDFGSLLAKNPNSPCHNCYADNRGNYTYESLKTWSVITFNWYVSFTMERRNDHAN